MPLIISMLISPFHVAAFISPVSLRHAIASAMPYDAAAAAAPYAAYDAVYASRQHIVLRLRCRFSPLDLMPTILPDFAISSFFTLR